MQWVRLLLCPDPLGKRRLARRPIPGRVQRQPPADATTGGVYTLSGISRQHEVREDFGIFEQGDEGESDGPCHSLALHKTR